MRDPRAVLQKGGAATCLDMAFLFAAPCLRARLTTHLVFQDRHERDGHAAVAVLLGDAAQGDPQLEGCTRSAPGVHDVTNPAAFRTMVGRGRSLAIVNAVDACHPVRQFTRALEQGTAIAEDAGPATTLVPVATRHRVGDRPLPTPLGCSALRSLLPHRFFDARVTSHTDVARELQWATGPAAGAGVTECAGLREAVTAAFHWARPDGVVLPSPAAAARPDQYVDDEEQGPFVDYRDRGAAFARAAADAAKQEGVVSPGPSDPAWPSAGCRPVSVRRPVLGPTIWILSPWLRSAPRTSVLVDDA